MLWLRTLTALDQLTAKYHIPGHNQTHSTHVPCQFFGKHTLISVASMYSVLLFGQNQTRTTNFFRQHNVTNWPEAANKNIITNCSQNINPNLIFSATTWRSIGKHLLLYLAKPLFAELPYAYIALQKKDYLWIRFLQSWKKYNTHGM